MVNRIFVEELKRDDELGLIKKEIRLPDGLTFKTPTKSIKHIKGDSFLDQNLTVNEIVENIDSNTIDSIESGGSADIIRNIRNKYKKNKLNLVIPNFKLDIIPNKSSLSDLAQLIYASSVSTILLPTVKTGLFKENNKFSDKKIDNYIKMMQLIIEKIQDVGNRKIVMGTVPLIPPKYTRLLINMYQSKDITVFAIDAGTKDVFLNEADFRIILSEINDKTKLNKTLIYACNVGYPHFQKHETRADDFLSIFAYIDILGGTFKTKKIKTKIPPRTKIFSKDNYSYKIFYPKSEESRKLLEIPNLLGANLSTLKNYNQSEQLKEAKKVIEIVGEDKIRKYLQTKKAIDPQSLKRLESIARSVKTE